MVAPLRVALLYGGKSGEHEISLRSAASVLATLDSQRYVVFPIGMDHNGCLYLNDAQELRAYDTSLPVETPNSKLLSGLIIDGKFALDVDVVFPVVHGPLYEDGGLQGVLDLTGVAYVGCGILASAIGMDKDLARRVGCCDDISYAPYRTLSWHASAEETQTFCHNVALELGWPLFVKPCSMGSSVGIHKANNSEELLHAVNDARRYDKTVIVEAFIPGREIELAVLENSNPVKDPLVSVAGEICVHHQDGFYSYTAKYLESDATELLIPAPVNSDLMQKLQQAAAKIFMRLKCSGMARIDFFVHKETNEIYFNEINTLPGFTSISMYPKLWEASGIEYNVILDKLIDLAMLHHDCRCQLVTQYN
jgi:D-alanine-D-alanine ligase